MNKSLKSDIGRMSLFLTKTYPKSLKMILKNTI
jgi:hypothetical protein